MTKSAAWRPARCRPRRSRCPHARGALEPDAVATPHGGVHRQSRHGFHNDLLTPLLPAATSRSAVVPPMTGCGGAGSPLLDLAEPRPGAAPGGGGGSRAGLHPRRSRHGQDPGHHLPDRARWSTRGVAAPAQILAVTFTTRAAGEMRARLRISARGGVQARTFHSAALRQLQYFWPRISAGAPADDHREQAAVRPCGSGTAAAAGRPATAA